MAKKKKIKAENEVAENTETSQPVVDEKKEPEEEKVSSKIRGIRGGIS